MKKEKTSKHVKFVVLLQTLCAKLWDILNKFLSLRTSPEQHPVVNTAALHPT